MVSGLGPLARLTESDDIAAAVLFRVPEASRNVSGEVLTVAAGTNPRL